MMREVYGNGRRNLESLFEIRIYVNLETLTGTKMNLVNWKLDDWSVMKFLGRWKKYIHINSYTISITRIIADHEYYLVSTYLISFIFTIIYLILNV